MKLKANELRIGNYINWNVSNRICVEEVTGIFIDTEDFVEKGEMLISSKTMQGELLSEFEPIPLTEEWLLKFGFEKAKESFIVKCGEYMLQVSINSFSGTLTNEPSWFISILTGYGSQPVTLVKKYVNQLQNLYFALTNEELTIKDND